MHHFDFYTTSPFCFPIKVTIDNTIAGIGTTIIHHDVAWLAHIIVHKDFRKRGIGQLITQSLVNSLKAENCQTIYLIATELGASVYEKVGFETETVYLFFKDIKIEDNSPISERIVPYIPEFRKQIADLDATISAEDRMFHLEKYLRNGFVYHDSSIVKGFYLPTFGNGLIFANSTLAGLNLLRLHLKSKDKVALPKDNAFIITYLHEHGFNEWSRGKRMRKGGKRAVQFENIYNRVGGNLG